MFEDTRCTCGLLKSTTRGRKEETERDVCCAARKVTIQLQIHQMTW